MQPIFQVDPVEFQPQFPICSAVVSSHKLILGLENGQICIINLQKAAPPDYLNVIPSIAIGSSNSSSSSSSSPIRKMFLDPSGRHLIIGTKSFDYYYLFLPIWKKAKPLSKFKGIHVTSIAWGPFPYGLEMDTMKVASNSTLECLVGSADGLIYETILEPTDEYFKKEEKYFKQVYSINDGSGDFYITDIHYEYMIPLGSNPANGPRLYFVVVTTRNRLCQFVGRQPLIYPPVNFPLFDVIFNQGFQTNQEFMAAFKDGQGVDSVDKEVLTSNLSFFSPTVSRESDTIVYAFDSSGRKLYPFINSKSFSWLTMAGVFHADLVPSYEALVQKSDHSIVEESKLIPYSTKDLFSPTSFPSFVAQTEFHVLLLHENNVSALCLLNADFVFEESINSVNPAIGLIRDPVENTFWIYCKNHLYEILVSEEDRDIWRIYLEKQQFDTAASYAKTVEQKNQVLIAQAKSYFDAQKYLLSATYYAQTNASIEKVCLLFYDLKEIEALKIYLRNKIYTYPSDTRSIQMTLLCTWLLLVYLQWLSGMRDSKGIGSCDEEKGIQSELFDFFRSPYFTRNAHKSTVFRLLNTYNRIEEFVEYAVIVKEIERVIDHHIAKGNHAEALEILDKHGSSDQIYKYSPKIMEKIPKDLVTALLKRKGDLNPKHLLPALLKYTSSIAHQIVPVEENHAISYLEFCVLNQKCRDPVIHNYLISLYAQYGHDESKLVSFLKSQDVFRYFDVQYALRVCMQYNRNLACIYLNGILENYEEAVDMSLAVNDMISARFYAGKPSGQDPGLSKRLWMKLAKHMIQCKSPVKEVVDLLYSTSDLKFEDILSLLPEGVWLDDFKEEIIKSLENTQIEIKSLKREMDSAASNADLLRKDFESLKLRSFVVEQTSCCSICGETILFGGNPFYIFPCKHYFHTECLMEYMKKWCSTRAMKRAQELQKRILCLGPEVKHDENIRNNFNLYREELDSIIASECLLCGDRMIDSIDSGFIDYDEENEEIESWL